MTVPDQDKPFEGILGNSSEVRVLENLLACQGLEMNISELSEMSDISRSLVITSMKRLLKWNVVEITKEVGRINLYKLNVDSPLTQKIIEFDNALIDKLAELEKLSNEWIINPIKTKETSQDMFNFSSFYNPSQTVEVDTPWIKLIENEKSNAVKNNNIEA